MRRKRPNGWLTATTRTTRERKAHGRAAPLGVRHWQIGNETSYDRNGFDLETAARKTVEFAKAMRAADPGDPADRLGRQRLGGRMAEVAGEHVQYLAFHHMFDPDYAAASRCCVASFTGAIRMRPGSS